MRVFVFLHVLAMVSAVTVAFGPAVIQRRAAQSRHVPTIRAVFGMAKFTGPLIPIFFLIGFVFAIISIFTNGWTPFQPWLLIAYVLFAIGMFDGFRIHAPYARAVAIAADKSPDTSMSPELRQALDNPAEAFVFWLDLAVITLILFDMIVKPFV